MDEFKNQGSNEKQDKLDNHSSDLELNLQNSGNKEQQLDEEGNINDDQLSEFSSNSKNSIQQQQILTKKYSSSVVTFSVDEEHSNKNQDDKKQNQIIEENEQDEVIPNEQQQNVKIDIRDTVEKNQHPDQNLLSRSDAESNQIITEEKCEQDFIDLDINSDNQLKNKSDGKIKKQLSVIVECSEIYSVTPSNRYSQDQQQKEQQQIQQSGVKLQTIKEQEQHEQMASEKFITVNAEKVKKQKTSTKKKKKKKSSQFADESQKQKEQSQKDLSTKKKKRLAKKPKKQQKQSNELSGIIEQNLPSFNMQHTEQIDIQDASHNHLMLTNKSSTIKKKTTKLRKKKSTLKTKQSINKTMKKEEMQMLAQTSVKNYEIGLNLLMFFRDARVHFADKLLFLYVTMLTIIDILICLFEFSGWASTKCEDQTMPAFFDYFNLVSAIIGKFSLINFVIQEITNNLPGDIPIPFIIPFAMTGVFPNFYMRILIYDYVDCEYRSSAIKLVFADFVTKLLGYKQPEICGRKLNTYLYSIQEELLCYF